MLRFFDLETLKVILLASPGFSAASLREHILAQATLTGLSSVLKAKSKFLVVHCSTGHLHSLNEVLKSDELKVKLADTKFAKESRAIDEFYKMIGIDEERAYYGPKHVIRAVEAGAGAGLSGASAEPGPHHPGRGQRAAAALLQPGARRVRAANPHRSWHRRADIDPAPEGRRVVGHAVHGRSHPGRDRGVVGRGSAHGPHRP